MKLSFSSLDNVRSKKRKECMPLFFSIIFFPLA